MKKNISIFLAGILVGSIIFGATMVFAADGAKNILVKFSNIKMVVNGRLVQSQFEPFTYNDKVFVPLRAVGEALQQQVGWENNTVFIAGGNTPKSLALQDMFVPTVNGLKLSVNSRMMAAEKEYKKGFYVTPTDKLAECKFSTSFSGLKQISGLVTLDDESKDAGGVTVTVLLDGKKVETLDLQKGSQPRELNIDAGAVNEVLFKVENGVGAKVDFIDMALKY